MASQEQFPTNLPLLATRCLQSSGISPLFTTCWTSWPSFLKPCQFTMCLNAFSILIGQKLTPTWNLHFVVLSLNRFHCSIKFVTSRQIDYFIPPIIIPQIDWLIKYWTGNTVFYPCLKCLNGWISWLNALSCRKTTTTTMLK